MTGQDKAQSCFARVAELCDAHVWILAGCPICALEREIIAREGADRRIEELEDKLLGCNRDRKEYRKQIDQLAKEKQDLAAQCARLRRKSREGSDDS